MSMCSIGSSREYFQNLRFSSFSFPTLVSTYSLRLHRKVPSRVYMGNMCHSKFRQLVIVKSPYISILKKFSVLE